MNEEVVVGDKRRGGERSGRGGREKGRSLRWMLLGRGVGWGFISSPILPLRLFWGDGRKDGVRRERCRSSERRVAGVVAPDFSDGRLFRKCVWSCNFACVYTPELDGQFHEPFAPLNSSCLRNSSET